jgi:nitrogen regulatory protein PII
MKMIWAVVRPECAEDVIGALMTAGISPVTCFDVAGFFDTAAGTAGCNDSDGRLLLTAVADNDVPRAVLAIRETVKAHGKDSLLQDSHGKIVISYIEDFFMIRSARKSRDGSG